MLETTKLKNVLLAAVKGVMHAHLEDLKNNGLLFTGNIMDVSVTDDMMSLRFDFSEDFRKFIEEHMSEGTFTDGLDRKTVIIVEDLESDG